MLSPLVRLVDYQEELVYVSNYHQSLIHFLQRNKELVKQALFRVEWHTNNFCGTL